VQRRPTKVTETAIRSATPPSSVLAAGGAARSAVNLVVITGMSGSGKGSVLRAFEDLGYFCVDNLPVELIPTFATLCERSPEIARAALVVDIREGQALSRLPAIYRSLRKEVRVTLLFLEAGDAALVRRYSETRRPHPLAADKSVSEAIAAERQMLKPIRALADLTVDTTKFNVHELRAFILERFHGGDETRPLLISCTSFGYRHGVPADSDLVFDVRFLPNPNYIPQFRPLSGRHPKVAKYIKAFPQTKEFIAKISELLIYLIPHYIREGKSYLTISFGCTGGQHRSVALADEFRKILSHAGYRVKAVHRDMPK
jgi:UPF0042 nucleotide-binding protein